MSLTGYGEPGGWSRDKTLFNLIFYGMLGYKAYANHYAVTGDQGWSVRAGLYAALRWKVWCGAMVVWGTSFLLASACLYYCPMNKPYWLLMAVVLIFGALSQGATWVLAIDTSLFRQGVFYKAFYGLAYRLRNVPWPLLTMVAALPWVFICFTYTSYSPEALSLRVPLDY